GKSTWRTGCAPFRQVSGVPAETAKRSPRCRGIEPWLRAAHFHLAQAKAPRPASPPARSPAAREDLSRRRPFARTDSDRGYARCLNHCSKKGVASALTAGACETLYQQRKQRSREVDAVGSFACKIAT